MGERCATCVAMVLAEELTDFLLVRNTASRHFMVAEVIR
jgi:hypothetical protein